MRAEDMVAELKSSGVYVRKEIVNGILDQEEESFPLLARFATSEEPWREDDGYTWSPVCAIHLLAKMKHYRAQLAINSAIMVYYDETGDWLTGDLPYVLAYMGKGAISTLIALVRYGGADMFVRRSAADALIMIINKHPKTKFRIVASIMGAARKEPDIETRSFLLDTLTDILDSDLYQYLKHALRTGFVTDTFFDLDFLDSLHVVGHTRIKDAVDPLYIFECCQK